MGSAQSDAEWAEQDREADAAELARLRESVIAKDAEIAELRARAHMLGSELREADLRAESYLQERSKAVSERDEARECVRRLCKFISFLRELYPDPIRGGCDGALTATPEHLR